MEIENKKALVEELIKKIVDCPNNSENYIKLASIYFSDNELDLAIGVYESLLNFEPSNYIALTNLGSIYFCKYEISVLLYAPPPPKTTSSIDVLGKINFLYESAITRAVKAVIVEIMSSFLFGADKKIFSAYSLLNNSRPVVLGGLIE